MATVAQINAGQRITAALLRAIAPLSAYKGADESVTTLTLQNDDALFLPVDANAVYFFAVFLDYVAGTQGSSDLKTGWTWPSGSAMTWTQLGRSTAGVAIAGNMSIQTGNPVLGANGAGVQVGAVLAGTLATSSASGTFQFQWCSNSGPVATTVKTGSALVAWKISG